MASDRGQNRYSDFVALETLLCFENCSSSNCLLSAWRRFHVLSLYSSHCFLRGTAGFSSWRRYGLLSSLRVVASLSSDLPFVDCATYLTAVSRHLSVGTSFMIIIMYLNIPRQPNKKVQALKAELTDAISRDLRMT